jgi:hypothetical protein
MMVKQLFCAQKWFELKSKSRYKAPTKESDFSKEFDETVIKMEEFREMNQGVEVMAECMRIGG